MLFFPPPLGSQHIEAMPEMSVEQVQPLKQLRNNGAGDDKGNSVVLEFERCMLGGNCPQQCYMVGFLV